MTYLNTQEGVADLFVKDVSECTAELLKDASAKTSGMVRDSLRHLYSVIFHVSTQPLIFVLNSSFHIIKH